MEAAREVGVAQVTVSEIVSRAGVSRRTFYEIFENASDCLLAAFEHSRRQAAEAIRAQQAAGGRSWREQMSAGVAGLLRFLEEQPLLGAFLIVDSAGAGQEVLSRRAETVRRLAEVVRKGERGARSKQGLTRMSAEGVVGAVLCVLGTRMLAGEKRLSRLHGELMAMIVRPYLGPAAAAAELARPAPASVRPTRSRESSHAKMPRLRLTERTMMVLSAVAAHPGASNREIGQTAQISDQGQISKLLTRLQGLGLLTNDGGPARRGLPNSWRLTTTGADVQRQLSGGS